MKYIAILLVMIPFTAQAQVTTNAEWYVREMYRSTPILAEIARCESGFTQFQGGKAIHGKVNPKDIGIMQINLDAHGETAKKLGFDLETMRGNLGYAKYLYQEKGDSPWIYSKKCWSKEA